MKQTIAVLTAVLMMVGFASCMGGANANDNPMATPDHGVPLENE